MRVYLTHYYFRLDRRSINYNKIRWRIIGDQKKKNGVNIVSAEFVYNYLQPSSSVFRFGPRTFSRIIHHTLTNITNIRVGSTLVFYVIFHHDNIWYFVDFKTVANRSARSVQYRAPLSGEGSRIKMGLRTWKLTFFCWNFESHLLSSLAVVIDVVSKILKAKN